jgi:hypothetical protein
MYYGNEILNHIRAIMMIVISSIVIVIMTQLDKTNGITHNRDD